MKSDTRGFVQKLMAVLGRDSCPDALIQDGGDGLNVAQGVLYFREFFTQIQF